MFLGRFWIFLLVTPLESFSWSYYKLEYLYREDRRDARFQWMGEGALYDHLDLLIYELKNLREYIYPGCSGGGGGRIAGGGVLEGGGVLGGFVWAHGSVDAADG